MNTSPHSSNLWGLVKASAQKRLGKRLLLAYLFVALVAILGVLASVGWMVFARQ